MTTLRSRFLILMPAACMLFATAACSTFKSNYYFQPRDTSGMEMKDRDSEHDLGLGDYAVFKRPGFKFSVRSPYADGLRHCIGPMIFPVVPNMRAFPASFKVEMKLEPAKTGAKIKIYPGRWVARTRAKEFGKTFGAKEIYKDTAPVNVQFQKGAGRYTISAGNYDMWTTKPSTKPAEQPAVVIPGATRAIITFPDFTNTFVDFELKNIVVEVDGRVYEIPPIKFKRKSDWEYTWFTMKIFDI